MAYKDPIKRREMVAQWKARNPEKHKAQRARYEKAHYNRLRLKPLGWTEERFAQTRELQGNACAVCKVTFIKTPHADHAHTDPPIPRGLLCSNCNLGLGLFKDKPEVLESAAQYLRSFIM